ncbi:MFS transporter [Paraphotobacterium marinum]|uniref:MFS transporter n=1 Tax=Paraphotobacterium marinum TaxID=1755811 RepID=A0A220VGF3_9GAMM|nr:MFS transporter [Paraphotobacterium marinum]ASK79330.1 MFS transporter [Paraphotobacterium marinum]
MRTDSFKLIKISLGNIIEWYDFCLYAYFAIEISKVFFSLHSTFISLLATFAVFGVGFLARPVGAIIFGYLGDQVGRHYAMNLSILLMGIATTLIGLLPSYASIGILAPISLAFLRLLQGLSLGGQYGNLLTITTEDKSFKFKGLNSGIAFSVSSLGFLLAVSVSYFVTKLIPNEYQNIAWRIPFILSFILLILQLMFKEKDSKINILSNNRAKKSPVLICFKEHTQSMVCITLLAAVTGALFYVIITYLVTYMTIHLHLSESESFGYNILSLVIICVFVPLSGLFSDYFGRKKSLCFGLLTLSVTTVPGFVLLYNPTPMNIITATFILALSTAVVQGVATPLYTEIFPKTVRASGCSISYGLGVAISGFAPMLAGIFVKLSPQYGLIGFVYFLNVTGLIAYYLIPKNKIKLIEETRKMNLIRALS